ncbi:CRISPR-associated protein Cas5 [Thermococcus chitonophagus]|uniref:CRISPR-associated protein Cas5 n=1 Tax=Thermococcus chitonophagus TaxID=54262 RepID=UPI000A71166C
MKLLGLVVDARPLQAHFRVPHSSLLLETYPFPPKTTAIGMVAGAMGLGERNFLQLVREVKYGVIIEDPGERIEEVSAIYKNPYSPSYPITRVSLYKPRFRMFFLGEEEVIERAYDALQDPVYVPYMGDSESLFYPNGRKFVEILNVEEGEETTLRSVLPGDAKIKEFKPLRKRIQVPRMYEAPVDFTVKGKSRRAVYGKFVAFSGGFVELEEPLKVVLFDGEPVFVF